MFGLILPCMLSANDTKIWRQMKNCDDHLTLQADIDYLLDWANNKIK